MDQQLSQDAPLSKGPPSADPVAEHPPSLPASTPPQSSVAPPTATSERPLNVSDALGYLDEVKNRFQDRPDVYNQFLDIMKDFKGQTLTTPGVIERVSLLFSGHHELISGFNTFLPPGYRIECSKGENQLITVTTPSGTLIQNAAGVFTTPLSRGAPLEPSRQDGDGETRVAEPEPPAEAPQHPPKPPSSRSNVTTPPSQPTAPPATHSIPVHTAFPPPNHSVAQVSALNYPPSLALSPAQALNSSSTATNAANVLGGMHRVTSHSEPVHSAHPPASLHPSLPQAQVPPVAPPTPIVTTGYPAPPTEFNHAIQYINRIKTRFADEPETYKQFLEILQTYQKEQRLLHDVYAQVTQLFRGAPDLIDEFKLFLPDTGPNVNSTTNVPPGVSPASPATFGGSPGGTVGVMGVLGQTGASGPVAHDTEWTMEVQSVKGDKGGGFRRKVGGSDQNREGPPVKKRKKAFDKEPRDRDRDNAPAKGVSRAIKSKHPHSRVPEPVSPPFPSYPRPSSPHGAVHHQPVVSQATAPPPSLSHITAPPASPEVFFDRVKRALDDRDAWDEFLKLLTLYSNDVMGEEILLRAAAPFLGSAGSELEMQFRSLLGIERAGRHDEFGAVPAAVGHAHGYGHPTGMGSTHLSGQKFKYGPSYRRLPDSETTVACSGRDELCRAVLNDDWVSHPTWASEESGFIAHKKNAFEEALHKSEEERHEYHVHLEAMAHTIALLEPIAYKINDMATEERATFRLRPDLGGRTASVYQKIIKKVYGRENSQEVLLALQENPAVAVPVVLDRLKQIDAEWRRNKREWEKVWRDVDARNFYKSLDHQGVGFKANDKKAITGKALVGEIERVKELQDSQRAAEEEDAAAQTDDPRAYAKCSRVVPRHQLEYDMHDEAVLQDALKLTISFLERNDQRQSGSSVPQYNAVERRRIEAFLRHYVMHQFGLGPEFDAVFGPPVDQAEWEDLGLYVADGDEDSADEMDAGTTRKNRKSGKRSGGSGSSSAAVSARELNNKLHKTKKAMDKGHGRKAARDTPKAHSNSNSSHPSPESSRHVSPAPHDSQPSSPARGVEQCQERAKGRAIDLEDVWLRHVELVIPSQHSQKPAMPNGIGHPSVNGDGDRQRTKHRHFGSFFCNNTFYSLIRLLHLLYSRLMACKSLARKFAADPAASFLPNPVATDLGLTDTAGPAAYFTTLAAGMYPLDLRRRSRRYSWTLTAHPPDTDNSSSNPAEYFYVHLLDLVEKVFDGELDQTTFEENMRFMFGTRAFVVYTLDKLCAAICKQVQATVQDSRCHELMSMLKQQRARDAEVDAYGTGGVDVQAVIRYRRQAEEIVGTDENLYRVDWALTPAGQLGENKCIRIQLLDKDDLSIDPPPLSQGPGFALMVKSGPSPETVNARMTARWEQYVQSYVLRYPTEGRRIGGGRKIFLRRTLLDEDADELVDTRWRSDTKPSQGLEILVGPGTCKLYYVSGCEETMWREPLAPSPPDEGERPVERRKRKSRKKGRGSEDEEEDAEEEEEVHVCERLRERAEARRKEQKRWLMACGL